MLEILECFSLNGTAVFCEPYGGGHINHTYLVKTDRNHPYILQRINDRIFRDVPALMHNISSVARYLQDQGLDHRHVLTLVPTSEGEEYVLFESEEAEKTAYYRVYEYVTDGLCLDCPETAWDFRQSALAFGGFLMQLKDFPAETLHETIPGFHDTVSRYRSLHRALREDRMGRAVEVSREADFALGQERHAGAMLDLLRSGDLPLRVTHNDTKSNNVMLDAATREPLCVIDLDTVMPGLSGNDFGESIRYGACSSSEDAQDPSRTELRLDLFRAYANGFLCACGTALTPVEVETLPLAAKLMTLENGIRFLTDYLEGDIYFRIHRSRQNLDRARTQFKLVFEMDRHADAMHAIIREEAAGTASCR